MAGFKEGALQLKKKDSLAPSDVGTMKVLINSSGQMYTVNELGVSALIQGGGGDDHKVISTSADTLPGTLSEKLVAGTNVYISAIGPTTSANLEIGTLGKLGVTSGDIQAYLQNKLVAGTGTIFEVIDGAYGKQIRISLDGSGGSNIDWPVITNVPIASTSTSGVLTSTDWNTFNNKQASLTSASNILVGNLSATNVSATNISGTNLYEGGLALSSKYAPINHTQSWNSISGVPVASTSTSGVITSEDFNNFSNRNITTGVVDFVPPITTYNPDGTITISSANVNLYDNPTYQGLIKTYNIGGQTLSLIDGAQQYIVADYNGGFPSFRIESNKNNINSSNVVGIYVTWRQGNNVHSIDFDSQGLQLPNKIARSILETEPYKISLDGGLVLSETSTPLSRTILVTSAVVYAGTTPHQVEPYNSSTDILTLVNHIGGVWTYTSGTTQYNNTQYDNGTSLVNMTNSSKYSVRWFYRSIGNSKEVFYVLGSDEYNSITNAQLEKQRNDLPDIIKGHCILIGRIIIKSGESSGLVETVSTDSFSSAQVSNHNDLANIQGGAAGEYYHLSATTFNLLTSGGNTSLHNHSFDRDRANHTGTQLASTISNFVISARTSISSTTPINYNSSTGVISISAANTNTHGYLTSADWNTFNNKQAALTSASNIIVGNISATNIIDTNYTGNKALISNADKSLGESSVTSSELGYVSGVTSSIQTQLNTLTTRANNVSALYVVTKEPTGFYSPENVTLSYSEVNRTITLGGSVSAYWRGVLVPTLSAGWVSTPHPSPISATQYLYYNGTSTVWTSTPWTFDMLHIAVVCIDSNGVVQFAIREPHGLMAWETHKECHNNIGTYINSTGGGDFSNYTLDSTSNKRPYISSLIVNDEDVETTLPALVTNSYTLLNNVGTMANYTSASSDIVLLSTNRPYFNQFFGGTWSNVLFANNSYGAIFVMAIPSTNDTLSQNKRFLFVQPQQNGSLVDIQALTPANVNITNLTNITPEFVFFAKIIIRYTGVDWSITSVEKLLGYRTGQSSTSVTGLITVTTDGTSISGTGIASSPLKLVNIGTSGIYSNIVTNQYGQVTSARNITSADIPNLDYSKITTGKPTTLAGYGVTSADTLFDSKYSLVTHNHGSQYISKFGDTINDNATIISYGASAGGFFTQNKNSYFPNELHSAAITGGVISWGRNGYKFAQAMYTGNDTTGDVEFYNNNGGFKFNVPITFVQGQTFPTTTRWTSAISITTGQQTISAAHNLNYQYPDIRCYDNISNELVVLEPSYDISTTNILVIPFNSSKAHSITVIVEK